MAESDINKEPHENPQFRIFCPEELERNKDKFFEEGTQQPIISFFAEDKIAVCPECGKKYIIKSMYIENVDNHKVLQENPYWKHSFIAETTAGDERLIHLETIEPLGIKKGTLVTLVQNGANPIGIADHSRSLWFPIYEKPENPIWKSYLQLIAGLLVFLIVLQIIHFFDAYSGSYIALILICLVFVAIFYLPGILKLGEGGLKQSQKNRVQQHLPWLNRE